MRRPLADFLLGKVALFEVFVHQLLARFRHGLEHPLAPFFGLRLQVFRDIGEFVGQALILFVPIDRLHADEVDDAREILFCSDSQLHRYRVRAQPVLYLPHNAQEIGPDTIHLVYENDARHFIAVGLAPHGLRLRFDTRRGAEDDDCTIEDSQAALHLDGEVHVSGRIDDVDAMALILLVHALPETGGGRGSNGDAPFLLLLHPVHDRGAVVHFADLVGEPGIEQHAFGGGGLARIYMGHDADIPITGNGSFTSHRRSPGTLQTRIELGFRSGSARTPDSLPPCGACLPAA